MLFAPVNGPPAAAPRGGLLAAAQQGQNDVPWQSGVIMWTESTGGWRVVQDCTPEIDDHGIDDLDGPPVGGRPVVLQTKITTRRTTIEEMSGRARRRMEAVTGKALAYELWTGTATQLDPYELPGNMPYGNPQAGDGYVNPYLLDPQGEIYTEPLPPLAAVGEVESRLGDILTTGPGYVHVPLAILGELAQFLDRRGDMLYTAAGNVVVTDGGYPGTGPAGTGRYVFGTDAITYWAGPITVLDDPSQVVNVADNRAEVWAERPAMTIFNSQTLVGCPVEVP